MRKGIVKRFRRTVTKVYYEVMSNLINRTEDSQAFHSASEPTNTISTGTEPACSFLHLLPIELRLEIYNFALNDPRSYTFGLTPKLTPTSEWKFEDSLLSVVSPVVIPFCCSLWNEAEKEFKDPDITRQSLLLVNKQVHEEVKVHMKKPRSMSIFLQYPYGFHLFHGALSLLRQARSVHIAGVYRSFETSEQRGSYSGPVVLYIPPHTRGEHSTHSTAQLAGLVQSMFGREDVAIHSGVEMFQMRLYYPGLDSLRTVWEDDDSPIVVALRNISAANIHIETATGQYGTGIHLQVTPPNEKRAKIIMQTSSRLEEDGRDVLACGTWLVDPKWPNWTTEEVKSDSQSDTSS